jgi:hypothetical protein
MADMFTGTVAPDVNTTKTATTTAPQYYTDYLSGLAGAGKTEIRIAGATGSFAVGDVLTYYSTFPTALESGTISKVDSYGKIYLS